MIKLFFVTVFYQPLYNGLILLLDVLPFSDLGLAVIIFTIAIKVILLPLSKKSLETQIKVKKIEPEINKLKEKYKNDPQTQGLKMMEIYKENGINPFSGFLLILIQIPIIFSLYYIFLSGGLPVVKMDLLYSFVSAPAEISTHFFGLINLSQRSLILAILAGLTQFFQIRAAMPPTPPKKSGERNFKDDLARSFSIQMRYIMPVMITFIAYGLNAVVALYWTVSNIVGLGQEYLIKRRIYAKHENK